MINILGYGKSVINVLFTVVSDNHPADCKTVQEIAKQHKCIKFGCTKYSEKQATYTIFFKERNDNYESCIKAIKSCPLYDKNVNLHLS